MYGDKGDTGDTGNGIVSITEYYLASSNSVGVTTDISGWTTAIQNTTSVKKFLWNYEDILYTNGQSVKTTPVIIGTYGDKGDKGEQGEKEIKVSKEKKAKKVTVIPSSEHGIRDCLYQKWELSRWVVAPMSQR